MTTLSYIASSDVFKLSHDYTLSVGGITSKSKLTYDFHFGLFCFGSGTFSYSATSSIINEKWSCSYDVIQIDSNLNFSFEPAQKKDNGELLMGTWSAASKTMDAKVQLVLGFGIIK